MTRLAQLHQQWMKELKYRKAYDALEDEFAVAKAVIAARSRAGLSQTKLVKEVGTK